MKTMWMGFAALALILTSCSKNETFENEASANAIRFRNLNDRLTTRAANDTNSNYGVYALLNNGTPAATGWFMDNQLVKGTDNSYSTLKFWPRVGTIDFYAYAPHASANLTLTGVAWNATTPTFGLSYTVPANADEDLTIAAPVTGASQATGQVGLVFSHMLSRFDFSAQLAQELVDDNFALTLNSVSVKVAYNSGTNSLSNPGTWSDLAGSGITYSGVSSYMIMPQPAIDTEITLNVTITHNGEDYFEGALKTYVLKAGDVKTADLFSNGTKYLFSALVGETTHDEDDDPIFNVISFTSTTSPWVDSPVSVNP